MTIPDKDPKQLAKEIQDFLYKVLPYQEQEGLEIAEYFLKHIKEIQYYWDGLEGHSYSYWNEVMTNMGINNEH